MSPSPIAIAAMALGTDKSTPELDKQIGKALLKEAKVVLKEILKDEELRLVTGGLGYPGFEQAVHQPHTG